MIYVFEWHSRGQRFDPAYLHQIRKSELLQKVRIFYFIPEMHRLLFFLSKGRAARNSGTAAGMKMGAVLQPDL